jgi:large subunit ribosomal protein L4
MRRLALRSALSAKYHAGQIVLVDELSMDHPKTRELVGILDRLTGGVGSAIILLSDEDIAVEKSVSNLPNAKTLRAEYLNIRDLLGYDYVIIPLAALEIIENNLGESQEGA